MQCIVFFFYEIYFERNTWVLSRIGRVSTRSIFTKQYTLYISMRASHQRQKYVTACTAEVQTVLCMGASQRCHSALQCRSALQHHNNVTVHYSVEVSTGRVAVQERAGQLSLLGRCCHNNTIMTVTMMMTMIIERSSRMCWRERPCLCSSENILYHVLGNAL